MAQGSPGRRDGPFPEIRDVFTQKQTWAVAIVFSALLIVMVRWPRRMIASRVGNEQATGTSNPHAFGHLVDPRFNESQRAKHNVC